MNKDNNTIEFDAKNYWENRLNKNFGFHGTGYLGLGKQFNNWLYRIKKKVFLRIIDKWNLNMKLMDIIDIGSGTGFYIELWKTFHPRMIVGTDITDISVKNLKEKFPNDKFFRLDIGDKIELSEYDKYDIVSAFDMLYHIVDDTRFDKAIQNIHNLLKTGGLFIFSENFLHTTTIRGEHQVSRSLLDIENMLQKNGFLILKRAPQFVLMNAPIDSESSLFHLLWNTTVNIVGKSEFAGFVLGAILYPLELILTSCLKESPTSEIMICKKI